MSRRPACPCGWGPHLVNAAAIILLARETSHDLAWRDRMWTLATLFADTKGATP